MFFQNRFQRWEIPEMVSTSCNVYNSESDGHFPLHCHSYYELVYLAKGKMHQFIDGRNHIMEENTLCLIPPLASHSNRNITATQALILQFSPTFLIGSSPKIRNKYALSRPDGESPLFTLDKKGDIYSNIQYITKFCSERQEFHSDIFIDLKQSSLVLSLISVMLEEHELTLCENPNSISQIPNIDMVINYILSNPQGRIDMNKAANMANMSYYAFSRNFKNAVGMNFTDYCNMLRIRFAEELLMTTELSVSEVAARIGIDTQSYFTLLFKQINGMSPTHFRSENCLK